MCERCVSITAAVDEAVSSEALPEVCSSVGCEALPVVRIAPSEDSVELLCIRCLLQLAAIGSVRALCTALEEAGVVVPEKSQWTLASVNSDRILDSLEVL